MFFKDLAKKVLEFKDLENSKYLNEVELCNYIEVVENTIKRLNLKLKDLKRELKIVENQKFETRFKTLFPGQVFEYYKNVLHCDIYNKNIDYQLFVDTISNQTKNDILDYYKK